MGGAISLYARVGPARREGLLKRSRKSPILSLPSRADELLFKICLRMRFLAARVIRPLLDPLEEPYLLRWGSQPLKHQPIFIIGAPRTGSTILYQLLTNQYDVLYIDNLVHMFFRNFFFGFWLSDKIFRQRPHDCFRATLGDTQREGLRAPSECGDFWYRWLPRDRHYVESSDYDESDILEIQRNITAVSNYFDKSLLIKNNMMGLRLGLLKRAFPKARYIYIKRDALSVSLSLLKARQRFYGSTTSWWSMRPPNYRELTSLTPEEQVVHQVHSIDRTIARELNELIGQESYLQIDYERFCHQGSETVAAIARFCLQGVKERNGAVKPTLSYSSGGCEEPTRSRVQNVIDRLDWS